MSKPRVLICGDVNGKFKTLFSRVENIVEKNGPFDMLLCVGTFFGANNRALEPYVNGSETVPVPTYILGPNSSDHSNLYSDISGCEICPNINYLGRRGLYTSTSGLKIAYLSGIEAETESEVKPANHIFTSSDVEALKNACVRGQNFRGVDILISSSWPRDIVLRGNTKNYPEGSWLISWLAAHVKPRYHFTGMTNVFYERPPYRNCSFTGDTAEHTTRFIGLAKVGNPSKEKWIYALTLDPIHGMRATDLYQATTDQTDCPYSGRMLFPSLSHKQERSQFFYDMASPSEEESHRKKSRTDNKQKQRKAPIFDQESCWFCLSSSTVERHLIISVGDEAYLALAKGGIVPDHVLILPIGHHQSSSVLSETAEEEISKFKSALRKFFKKQQKVPVFFERNYKTSHLQIQAVPIPSDQAPQLKQLFQETAEEEGLDLDELPPFAKLSQIAPPGTPYFHVELPTGEKLFHRVRKNFPLQFGREVLASEGVLNMAHRVEWKDCNTSKDEETIVAKKFRNEFQPFDFTLNE